MLVRFLLFVTSACLTLAYLAKRPFPRKSATSFMKKISIQNEEIDMSSAVSEVQRLPRSKVSARLADYFPPDSKEAASSLTIEKALHLAFKKSHVSSFYTARWRSRDEIVARRGEFGGCQLLFESSSLDIPLVDFDPEASIKTIVVKSRISSTVSSSRSIPMLCMVRGKGGGKTRALQEVCFEALLEHHQCLGVGVTFNSNSEIAEDASAEKLFWDLLKKESSSVDAFDAGDLLVFSVCCRMLSSFYDVDFPRALQRLRDILKKLPGQWSGEVLFVTVANHLLYHTRQHRPIDKFLLLIDESKKAHAALTEEYGVKDPYSKLRQILLSPKFFDKMAKPMLVMSSLEVLPSLTCSSSSRKILAIPLPETLDRNRVAHILHMKLLNAKVGRCAETDVILWASLFNNIPRTLEYALSAVDEAVSHVTHPIVFDANFTRAWLWQIRDMCDEYSGIKFDERLLRPLILSEKVSVLDTSVRRFIEMSVFVNSLQVMPVLSYDGKVLLSNYEMVPVTSPFLLWVWLSREEQIDNAILRRMRTLVTDIVTFMEDRSSITEMGEVAATAGALLGKLMAGIVQLRLLASAVPPFPSSDGDGSAKEAFRPSVSLRKLFAIPDDFGSSGVLDVDIDLSSIANQKIPRVRSSTIAKSSCDGSNEESSLQEFLKVLGGVVVSQESPVTLLTLNEAEQADGGLLIYRGERQVPLLVLWDCKSRSPTSPEKLGSSYESDWERARYWCSQVPSDARTKTIVSQMSASKSSGQSALRAFADGQLLFMYADDAPRPNVIARKWLDGVMTDVTEEEEKGCLLAIRLNRSIMNNMLVFCAAHYSAVRSLGSASIALRY